LTKTYRKLHYNGLKCLDIDNVIYTAGNKRNTATEKPRSVQPKRC